MSYVDTNLLKKMMCEYLGVDWNAAIILIPVLEFVDTIDAYHVKKQDCTTCANLNSKDGTCDDCHPVGPLSNWKPIVSVAKYCNDCVWVERPEGIYPCKYCDNPKFLKTDERINDIVSENDRINEMRRNKLSTKG